MNHERACGETGVLSDRVPGVADGRRPDLVAPCSSAGTTAEDEAVLSRVTEDIRILSSDEMEGRGPGTQGLEKAGDYIRDEFRQLGLKSGAADDSYRQPFQVSLDFKPVPDKTSLTLRGPDGQAWQLEIGRDFQALAAGGSGKAQAPLVFAGYGISAPSLGYDDFEGLDVEGKVLLVLRQEPQQGDAEQQVRRQEHHETLVYQHQAAAGQGAKSGRRAVGQCPFQLRRPRAEISFLRRTPSVPKPKAFRSPKSARRSSTSCWLPRRCRRRPTSS